MKHTLQLNLAFDLSEIKLGQTFSHLLMLVILNKMIYLVNAEEANSKLESLYWLDTRDE